MTFVPYYPGQSARRMVMGALSTTGTRRAGRLPHIPRHMSRRLHIQPIVPATNVLQGLGTYVSYERAKRGLSGLGITGAQAGTGISTGLTASSAAGSIGASVASIVGASAAAGSVVPVIGTAIGAIVGLLASGILNKQDQEVGNFDQAVNIWNQNRLAVLNIANKYLVLAGLFDLSLNNPHIPIYLQYGRMGEQRFVTDMMTRIYNAAAAGQITINDTPETIMARIVQPWIDSWGKGAMVDPHADMINLIMEGMIADYVSGQQSRWLARSGDYPFGSLPAFPLQQILAAAQPQPAPVAAPPPPPPLPPPPPPPMLISQPGGAVTLGPSLPVVQVAPNPVPNAPLPPNTIVTSGPVIAQPVQQPLPAVVPPSCGTGFVWNGTQCVASPVTPATVAPPPAPNTTAPVAVVAAAPPPGFTQVGTDSNGNPVFGNAQGMLYEWNGSAMQLFTGQLSSSQGLAQQLQSAIQQALAQGQSANQAAQTALAQAQAAGQNVTPAVLPQLTQQAQATAAAPTVDAASTVAPGTSGWLVGGVGILLLIMATARPARGSGNHG